MTRVLRFTSRLWRALQTGQTLPGREVLRSTVILFLSMLRERSSRSGPGPFPAVHFFANASQGRDQKNDHECCCCCHDNRSDHHPEHDSAVGHAHLRRHSLSGTSTRRIVAGSFVSRTITPTRLSDVGKGKEMRSRPREISRLGRKCSRSARQSCSCLWNSQLPECVIGIALRTADVEPLEALHSANRPSVRMRVLQHGFRQGEFRTRSRHSRATGRRDAGRLGLECAAAGTGLCVRCAVRRASTHRRTGEVG